ncbi:MAG: peptidylprolyl isomerase [Bosea sp. (in: a-proteobacteria)]
MSHTATPRKTTPRTAACFAVIAAATLLMAAPAIAQAPADKVLARVDGQAITQGDVDVAVEDLGERLPRGMNEDQRRAYVVDFLVDLRIGAKAADAAKLADAPDFARRLTYFRQKLLMDDFLMREAKKSVSEEAARKLYDESIKQMPREPEVRARHILVEKEEDAKKALERVKGGKEDFAKVAAELSSDPGSKTDGGELGWFSKDRMVQTFAEAAFKLDVGQISEPVKTQFGWHIIKLEEKRMKEAPAFEQVKPEIDKYLMRQGQEKVILGLREKAKIERLDQPAAPADAKPAEPKKN